MKNSQEWGSFWPFAHLPFAYNESAAMDYFPLTMDEALKRGFRWRDEEEKAPSVEKVIPASQLPDRIQDIPDDVLQWVITCETSGKSFRIIKQELDFYRRMHLPLPREHPEARHKRRMGMRNPYKLWMRSCSKCGNKIETSFAPERKENVYCEECYLKEVY
ncbi:hypothetical protein HY213_04145 [Candidatus Peregrinibacteria bacterium]|nr:hypothetical protein [Candidatus Peregrinibacteria bacterium]